MADRYEPNGTPLNDYERELLTILMEECAEVIQAASKLVRFGKENRPPKSDDSPGLMNTEFLSMEYGHVCQVAALVINANLMSSWWINRGVDEKRERLLHFMQTQPSERLGSIDHMPEHNADDRSEA